MWNSEVHTIDAGVLRANGQPDQPVSFYETTHGPVIGTGAILSLQETNAAPSRFFAVEVQP